MGGVFIFEAVFGFVVGLVVWWGFRDLVSVIGFVCLGFGLIRK